MSGVTKYQSCVQYFFHSPSTISTIFFILKLIVANMSTRNLRHLETSPCTHKGLSFQQTSPDSSADCNEQQEVNVEKNNSCQQQKQYVHIITQIPQEILCLIISFLSMDTRVQCTKICRAWRNICLQCPELWEDIKDEDEEMYRLLPLISHHVVKLIVCNVNVPPFVRRTDKFIHLQALSISIEGNKKNIKTLQ